MSGGDEKKVASALLDSIKGGTNLRHAEMTEKNQLPTNEVLAQEKTVESIGTFDHNNLKHAHTDEKTGWKEAIKHDKTTEELGKFDKGQLKHAETTEKNALPDKDVIQDEKKEVEHRKSIGDFDKSQLKRQNTMEKIVLPTNEVINQEKKEVELRDSIGNHNRNSMKKVETNEKDPLKELVAQEATQKGIEKFSKECLKHADTQEKNILPTAADIKAERKSSA